jgi:hypothetical protein
LTRVDFLPTGHTSFVLWPVYGTTCSGKCSATDWSISRTQRNRLAHALNGNSTSNVARSERILNAIGSQVGLSEPGKEWLLASLDPFHDNTIKCTGYPDNISAASVVQCVKQSFSIAVPSTITAGLWDCHITHLPFLETAAMSYAENFNGNSWTFPATPSAPMGGITVWVTPAGGNTFSAPPTATSFCTSYPIPYAYSNGACRVIASGFEVTNTTSALNAQGTVTCYKAPVSDFTVNSGAFVALSTPAIPPAGNFQLFSFQSPPANIANAMLLAGTKQWAAKEGAYVVPTFQSLSIPVQYEIGLGIAMPIGANDAVFGSNQFGWLGNASLVSTGATSLGPYVPAATQYTPNFFSTFNMAGAYFTGLSLQTTLTLTWNVYIERFPSFDDGNLVVLATPSPPYDVKALEIYSSVAYHMPPGVMAKENGLGEWFAEAVNFAKDVVAPVLSCIPHPIAMAASAGIDKFATNYQNRQQQTSRQGNTARSTPPPRQARKPAQKTQIEVVEGGKLVAAGPAFKSRIPVYTKRK